MDFNVTDDLTPGEMQALDELKEKVSKKLENEDLAEMKKDDAMFLRFLRARDFDVNKAAAMLTKHIDWRKQNEIDKIVNFKSPEVVKYFPLSNIGVDKEGHPIRVFCFGRMDLKGLLKAAKKSTCVKTVLRMFEMDVRQMKRESEKRGRLIDTWHYIFDFEGYTFSQATHKPSLELLVHLFVAYEANYPERLASAYIVNASIYFTILFSVIKPFLSGNTLKKIKIFGKEHWREELLEFIDPEVLPAYLGGTRTDPDGDPRCPSVVIPGVPVPEHYYFKSPEQRLSNKAGVKKYHVSRMSKKEIILDVDEAGSCIEWEFQTENHDICFGLFYKETDAENNEMMTELVPKQRMGGDSACESGMYLCDKSGIYVLIFDNTYSWWQEKDVYCRAQVASSKNKEILLTD